MLRSLLIVAALLSAAVCPHARAGVINGDFAEGLAGWTPSQNRAEYTVVNAPGVAGGKAVRVVLDGSQDKPWRVQLRQNFAESVAAGGVVGVVVVARSPQSLDLLASLRRSSPPYRGVAQGRHTLSPTWQAYRFRGRADEGLPPGSTEVALSLATGTGVIEIAEVRVAGEAVGGGPSVTEALPEGVERVAVRNGDFAEGLDHWRYGEAGASVEAVTLDEPVAVDGGTTDTAVRVTLPGTADKVWRTQLRQRVEAALRPGDRVTVLASMRSPDALDAVGGLNLASAPFTGLFLEQATPAHEWRRVAFRGTIDRQLAAGEAQLFFSLASGEGVIELTGVEVAIERAGASRPDAAPTAELPDVALSSIPLGGGERFPAVTAPDLLDFPQRHTITRRGPGEAAGVSVDGPYFDRALRLTSTGRPEHAYHFGAITPIRGVVSPRDALALVFAVRVIEADPLDGRGEVAVVFERAGGDYHKSVEWGTSLHAGEAWQVVALPFHAASRYGAAEANVAFRAGFGPQTIEIGGVHLLNLGPGVSLADLPRTRTRYVGDAADAAWRAEAERRIARHRTGELTVRVVDAEGRPVADTPVHVEMTRNAFAFGSALSLQALPQPMSNWRDNAYLVHAEEMFNAGVLENALKWKHIDKPGTLEQADEATDWMTERGWYVRGHTLLWASWRRMPRHLMHLRDDPVALREAIHARTRDLVSRYRGRIDAWDVLNEPYVQNEIIDMLGESIIDQVFTIAHEADPEAMLFLNDFGLLTGSGPDTARIDYYLDLVQRLRDRGVPVHGMGLQGHFGGQVPGIDHLLAVIDRFADAGLRVHITEFDINTRDEKLRASYTRDALTAAYSHPAVDAFVLWGFWESRMWKSHAAMFETDWTPKPVAEAWRELIHERWRTDATVTTDDRGVARLRTHCGDYRLTLGGKASRAVTTSLTPEGASVVMRK